MTKMFGYEKKKFAYPTCLYQEYKLGKGFHFSQKLELIGTWRPLLQVTYDNEPWRGGFILEYHSSDPYEFFQWCKLVYVWSPLSKAKFHEICMEELIWSPYFKTKDRFYDKAPYKKGRHALIVRDDLMADVNEVPFLGIEVPSYDMEKPEFEPGGLSLVQGSDLTLCS